MGVQRRDKRSGASGERRASSESDLARELVESYRAHSLGERGARLPSADEVAAQFEEVRDLLFPGLTGRRLQLSPEAVAKRLVTLRGRLERQVLLGILRRAGEKDGPAERAV